MSNWITGSEEFARTIEAVEHEFCVPRAAIEGRSRSSGIIVARHALWWLLRRRGRYSYPELGAVLESARDHTTVMSAIRSFEARLRRSPEFADRMAQLELRLEWRPIQRVRVAIAEESVVAS